MLPKTTACVARHVAALIAAIVAASLIPAYAATGPAQQNSGEPHFVKGRLLVQPRAGLKTRDLDDILRGHGGRRVDAIPQLNVHIVELPPQANDHIVAQALRGHRHIKSAEVDRQVLPAYLPNDVGYPNAWHLPKIGSPKAWDYSVGTGVTVAILDTGVDPSHPDLVGNLVPGFNTYDNNTDTHDVQGHGTSVAGTAAMAGNNSIGGAGVAFKSKIMPIRITDLNAVGYISTLSKGITWAADHGARIASMSFSGVCGSTTLINAAQYMRSKGGVVTAAAGNAGVDEGQTPSDAITCVSASDSNDVKTSWSSFGAYVDVAAPGAGIYTTASGGGYGAVSGTSFSAPMTAGVYALMMAANPQLTPSQLDTALFSTAVDLGTPGKDINYGYGRINAGAAVASVSIAPPVDTTQPSVTVASPAVAAVVKGLVPVDVTASDNVGVIRVDLYAGGQLVGSDAASPYGFSWDTSGVPDGAVTLEARALDAAGNVGVRQVTVTVSNANAGGNTGSTNVALASAGAVASASSTYGAGRPVAALNDNKRSGTGWDNGGGWSDSTSDVFPDWAQINFNGTKSIDRVVVYSVQDNYLNPIEPTDSMTSSLFSLVDFTVQGWSGSAWITLGSVTGNNLIKRTVTFPAFSTDRIRVNVTKALNTYSRMTEIEAWGNAVSSSVPGPTNVALASAGGVPSASSAYAGHPIAALNDNQRSGAGWNNGGGWNDATYDVFPDWAQISFNGAKSIDRVIVYGVQDDWTNPIEPTDSMTSSLFTLRDFTVQGWNGSAWVTLGTVTGNSLVKRTVTFPAFTTDRVRVNITNALSNYSRITEIEAWGVPAASASGPTNVALTSVGAVSSASSTYGPGRPVASLNDNKRSGAGWDNGGGWSDASPGAFPDWAQINFNGSKTIDRVIVYSVQDNYTNPVEPTDSMTSSLFSLVNFTVQGWNGSAWVTLANVTGNNLIKRTVTFPAFTTDRIRVNVTNALNSYSRITEIEAWGQ